LTDNHKRSKEWLSLAFNNIERVIRNFKDNDYVACVFRIQLSIEQLQKAIIFLLGLQFRKIHEPSKILESVEFNNNIQIEKKNLDQIKLIAELAKNIEEEGTDTRYGRIIDDKLISPEDKYDKTEASKFLNDLKEILIILKDLLKNISNFEKEVEKIIEYIKGIKELSKIEPN
jgi:HEPN domain-containing protein